MLLAKGEPSSKQRGKREGTNERSDGRKGSDDGQLQAVQVVVAVRRGKVAAVDSGGAVRKTNIMVKEERK
jgi:hypothetical protein